MAGQKVLFVDDDRNILAAFKRQLRGVVELDTASGGREGLEALKTRGPFAAIVVDMQMPELNGVDLLREARRIAPDVTRIMLTGNADQDTAARALNEGQIFRFVNKPCSTEILGATVSQAIEQHRLVTAEKELLQKTLAGSVKILTDILSIVDPQSFGSIVSLREPLRKVAKELGFDNPWEMELAAMLSSIGKVLLPAGVGQKLALGQALTEVEKSIVASIPEASRKLIANLPRLEKVAEIVRYAEKNFDGSGYPLDDMAGEKLPLGSRLIRVLRDLLAREQQGQGRVAAIEAMAKVGGSYDPNILNVVLRTLADVASRAEVVEQVKAHFEITLKQLIPGQKLVADVLTKDGVLLITKGATLSESHVQRIKNYAGLVGVVEPILVDCLIPSVDND